MLHIAMNKEGPQSFPDNAVSVVCVPELPSVATNHGVFVGSNISAPPNDILTGLEATSSSGSGETYHTNIAANYLQKPDVVEMRAKGAICLRSSTDFSAKSNQEDDEFALIDTGITPTPQCVISHLLVKFLIAGVVIFTGSALTALVGLLESDVISRCTSRDLTILPANVQAARPLDVLRFELYSDILLALRFNEILPLTDGITVTSQRDTLTAHGGDDLNSYYHRLGVAPGEENSLYDKALPLFHAALHLFPLYYIYVPGGCFEVCNKCLDCAQMC
jgi:hypothetical protein